MMRCCVAFCKITTDNVTEPEHVTFHEFPTELHQRDAWLRALGKHDTVLPEPAVVCSQHFLYDDMYETNSGSRQICNGAIPCTVKVCIICFDTDSRMLLINKYNLEKPYENLTGHSLCVGGNLKPMLCVECAQRLINFSRFRDKSLRARSLMLDLVTKHELISKRQIKSVNREKHQLKSNIVKTTLKPDHCNVFIQEHIVAEMKLDEENKEMCTRMVNEPNFVEVNEKTEHGDGDDDYSAVCKREDISDESIMLAIRLVDEAAMTARIQMKEAQAGGLLKYEEITRKCKVCFREFLNEEAWNEHMMIHVKPEGECASDACQSQCEYPPALRTDTRAPHTRSSSPGSSLRTGHSRPSQKPSEDGSSADSALTAVVRSPASLATNNEKKVHPTEVADTIHIHEQILTSDDDESHNKPSDTNNEPKHKRSRKAATKQNASLKIARGTNSSGNWNSQNKDTDSKHLNVPTTSSSVAITTDTGEPATETDNELYVSEPVQSESECTDSDNKRQCEDSTVNSIHTQLGKHSLNKCFICDMCQKTFKRNNDLVKHVRTRTAEEPYTCSLCNYKCCHKIILYRHMRTHTDEKPYTCSLCNYKCSRRIYLNYHMRTHTSEKPHTCSLCNYKCRQKSAFNRHMRTHTEKAFACSLCDYKCHQGSQLTSHMSTHTGKKPHACHLCDYKCSWTSQLTLHMRTHTDKKPFACSFCNFKCFEKRQLISHISNHTGKKPYSCNLCNFKYCQKSSLDRHKKTHTG